MGALRRRRAAVAGEGRPQCQRKQMSSYRSAPRPSSAVFMWRQLAAGGAVGSDHPFSVKAGGYSMTRPSCSTGGTAAAAHNGWAPATMVITFQQPQRRDRRQLSG